MQINAELKKYIEDDILTKYDTNNIGGHGKDHILTVIKRSFELVREFKLDVNLDMVYVIAAYHDIGYQEDPDNHESVSARIFLEDINMQRFFSDEEREIMAQAIVDHRASLEYEARSVYGKIVSSADREVSVENMLARSVAYQSDKHKSENPTPLQIVEYSYQKLSSKYGKGGYAKMYYPDQKYKDYLARMQELLLNKELFIETELRLIRNK